MSSRPPGRRRWRPRWLTTRAIALGSVFTIAIFAFALSVAALFAGQVPTGPGLQRGTPTQVVSPTPAVTEPND